MAPREVRHPTEEPRQGGGGGQGQGAVASERAEATPPGGLGQRPGKRQRAPRDGRAKRRPQNGGV
eukprot:7295442-Lingulodinium_polyedra.AAC.1